MRNRRPQMMRDEEGENFWPSFTDLISTISMILFVLVLLAYIQNLISGKQLNAMRTELDESARRIAAARSDLEASQLRLRGLSAEIAAGQEQLAASRAMIEQQAATVSESN